jgi:hypothetical protein
MHMTGRGRLGVAGAATLLITAILVFVPPPSRTKLWESVYNCGHAPLFGCFALLIYAVSPPGDSGRSFRVPRYGKALAVSLAVGLFTEIVQHFCGGDFELQDLARDVSGAFLFLLFLSSFDRHLPAVSGLPRQCTSAWIRIAAVTVMAGIWAPPILLGYDYARRDRAFPILFDPGQNWTESFTRLQAARLEWSHPPGNWQGQAAGTLALVRFEGKRYPGFAIDEPYPDWNGYRSLNFTVFSELSTRIVVRINDAEHNDEAEDRYNGTLEIRPGVNAVSIPLQEVFAAPSGRSMNMANIRKIVIFALDSPAPFSLLFSRIELCR